MKTEKEARELWCPHARHDGNNFTIADDGGRFHTPCIGSCCMMWEWVVEGNKYGDCSLKRG